jgi:PAS domain S-box-containing protein
MFGILDYLFGAASFMPHGYCLLWRPDLVAMHAVADALTAASYFSIPIVILMFLRRRGRFDHAWLAWLFIGFIAACGVTHAIGLVTLWQPVYGLEALAKLATAAISLATAALMWPLLPQALALPSPSALRRANDDLQAEIHQRQQAEAELRIAHQDLEQRVLARTRELEATNQQLARLNAEHERTLLRLQSILDNTVDALITIDEHGEVEGYNAACERIFGYPAEAVVGRNIRMLMDPTDAERHDGYLKRYLATGDARIIGFGREVVGRRADGSLVPLELSVSEIRLGDRRIFSGILRDISERKEAEARGEALVRQLRASNEELEQFAYVASHDLRTPLRALSILPQWLARDLEQAGSLIPEVEEHLTDMTTQVARMDRLLIDLLDYSRLGRADGAPTLIDSAEAVAQVRDLLRPAPGFDLSIEGDLPPVTVIATEFELVLRNLIANAIKHRDRDHGRIVVRGGWQSGEAYFEVSDDGPGIAPDYHRRIFDMFCTLRPRDEVEGSGMGLALIKKLVERWGGRVSVTSSAETRGSTFRFTLPAPVRSAA